MQGDLSDSETQGGVANRAKEPARHWGSVFLREQIEAERLRWFYWVPLFVGLGTLIYFRLPSEPGAVFVTAALVAAVALRAFGDRGPLFSVLFGATVAPIGIYHFHQVQYFALLANLLAIPTYNLIVMPAALATLLLIPFGRRVQRSLSWGRDLR